MKSIKYFVTSFLLLNLVNNIMCWQYFSSLHELTLSFLPDEEKKMGSHSEYRFGNCSLSSGHDLILYAHTFLEHMDVLGKLIIRGWLDIKRIPTCIVLRAISWAEDMFRSTSYEFQICVPRISYCHQHERWLYYYYEWYIPYNYIGGMDWHLNFYGPRKLAWG